MVCLLLNNQNQEKQEMELIKLFHDLAITGGCVVIAVLPRFITALAEAKADRQDQSAEGI
jgi:hypothetical protein